MDAQMDPLNRRIKELEAWIAQLENGEARLIERLARAESVCRSFGSGAVLAIADDKSSADHIFATLTYPRRQRWAECAERDGAITLATDEGQVTYTDIRRLEERP